CFPANGSSSCQFMTGQAGEIVMNTVSRHNLLAVADGVVLTKAAPGSSAASAGRFASRFRRPWFPGWRRLIGTGGPGLLIAIGYIDPRHRATELRRGARVGSVRPS